MAGDWIKIELTTPDKPEIDVLAELLGVTVNEVLGGLVRLWIWADQQTVDGNANSVTKCAIDRHSGVTGLADAMLSPRVRWLHERDSGGFLFPNFDRHNGQTAKRRALTAKRVSQCKHRKGNAISVTSALPREEKRREENNKIERARTSFVAPTMDDVRSYATEIGCSDYQAYWDHYQANGWRVGRNPMKDWQSALRNWKRRSGEFTARNGRGEPVPATVLDESLAEARKRIAKTRAQYIDTCRRPLEGTS